MPLTVFAMMKNEGPYLLEWVAWYRALGIGRLVIVDNASTDGTSEVLAALHDLGEVERHWFPDPVTPELQVDIYNALALEEGQASAWFAAFDADEFLVPTSELPLAALLERLPEDVGMVPVNWACFGSNGHRRHGPGLVMERFTRHAAPGAAQNCVFKSIVRARAFARYVNPHRVLLRDGFRTARADGSAVELPPVGGRTSSASWDGLRLNHYMIKSWDEFANRKRGRIFPVQSGTKAHPAFFVRSDLNDLAWAPPPSLAALAAEEIARLRGALASAGHGAALERAERPTPVPEGVDWRIERVDRAGATLVVQGWAADGSGYPAAGDLVFRLGDRRLPRARLEHLDRPDLAAQRGVHVACGFRAVLRCPADADPSQLRAHLPAELRRGRSPARGAVPG